MEQVWQVHSVETVESRQRPEYRYPKYHMPWLRWAKILSGSADGLNSV